MGDGWIGDSQTASAPSVTKWPRRARMPAILVRTPYGKGADISKTPVNVDLTAGSGNSNAFKGNDDAGIDVSNTDAANGVFGLDVSANSFDLNGRAVLLFNTHNSSFHGNTVTRSTAAMSAAVVAPLPAIDVRATISALN